MGNQTSLDGPLEKHACGDCATGDCANFDYANVDCASGDYANGDYANGDYDSGNCANGDYAHRVYASIHTASGDRSHYTELFETEILIRIFPFFISVLRFKEENKFFNSIAVIAISKIYFAKQYFKAHLTI
jgi:hypothetical protein